jgi:hypothetical protein
MDIQLVPTFCIAMLEVFLPPFQGCRHRYKLDRKCRRNPESRVDKFLDVGRQNGEHSGACDLGTRLNLLTFHLASQQKGRDTDQLQTSTPYLNEAEVPINDVDAQVKCAWF